MTTNAFAQTRLKDTNLFVRVYDLNYSGDKIASGKILSISDTSLQLKSKEDTITINLSQVSRIKTKRSAGHSALLGAGIGAGGSAASLGLIGLANNSGSGFSLSPGALAVVGAIIGIIPGALIGGTMSRTKSYEINGDLEKWKAFKNSVSN